MSTNRSRRIDHDTAELLLGGAEVGATGGHDALAGLLAAAATPPAAGELPGEQAALAAFRAARLAPVVLPSRKRSMLTSALARLLSAKVAAAVLATTLGGVAVAAGTGHLPAALGGTRTVNRPGPTATASAGATGAASAGTGARPTATVPAAVAELCRAFAQDGGPNRDGVLAERRFGALVDAAGGQAAVPGYCAPVLGGHGNGRDGSPTPQPTDSGPGTAPSKPGKSGASHQPGRPGASHGPDPSHHPTGAPTAAPSPPRRSAPTAHPKG